MRIVVVRSEVRGLKAALRASMAAFVSIASLVAILKAVGIHPSLFFTALMLQVSSVESIERLLTYLMPIMLCALSGIVAYRASLWNIGQEGQFIVGAVAALGISLSIPADPMLKPIIVIAGGLGGLAWALAAGILRALFQVNEAVSTLVLYYIAIYVLWQLTYIEWKDPGLRGFPFTYEVPEGLRLGTMDYVAISLAMLATYYIIVRWTVVGLAAGVLAEGSKASRYMGFREVVWVPVIMALSGFASGVAGALVLASQPPYRLFPSYFFGYGFSGIIAAWLSGLNPLLALPSSTLLAMLHGAVLTLQTEAQLSIWTIQLAQGIVLLAALLAIFFIRYSVRVVR